MKKALLLTTLIVTGLIGYFMLTKEATTANNNSRSTREVAVVTARVEQQSLAQKLTVIGKLDASKNVQIAPQISGKVANIYFDDNQQVERGQILIKLNDAKAKANRAEAQAKLLDEKRKLNEFKKLSRSNAITQTQIDAQNAMVAMAKAKLAAMQAELDYHTLTAPFSGFTGLKNFSEGKMVATGSELVSLDDLSVMYLDLAIPEQYLSHLKLGMNMSATSQAWPDETFIGKLQAVAPRLNQNTLTMTVRVAFDNPQLKLRPGMMMSTIAKLPAVSKPSIPVQALEYSGTKRFVYRLTNDHTAKRTQVILGSRIGDKVLIEQGINIGDEIVVQGLVNMRDGLKIKPLLQQSVALNNTQGTYH